MGVMDGVGQINTDFLLKGAAAITDADIKKVYDNAKKIRSKVDNTKLKNNINVLNMVELIIKYCGGTYTSINKEKGNVGVYSLLYLINPSDMIHDSIPVIGLSDDSMVLAKCSEYLEEEIKAYK